MKNKILHLMVLDKFIPPFIEIINENFDIQQHRFMIFGSENYQYGLSKNHPVEWLCEKSKKFLLLKAMYKAKKIIIHGLWHDPLNQKFLLHPWLLKKCYWLMWGGDFYFPEQNDWVKNQIIKRIAYCSTYIKGDYALLEEWYNSKGKYFECLMYPSNLFKEKPITERKCSTINIQIGNSATPSNNHFQAFEKLVDFKDEDMSIFCPLSYGEQDYANEVIAKGKELFGIKFHPLTEFIPFENYLDFLAEIDVALFANKRQQAMGNIITLLGFGKKVFMREDNTSWQLFRDINVKVFDINKLELSLIDEKIKANNREKVKQFFSKENYLNQLKIMFEN